MNSSMSSSLPPSGSRGWSSGSSCSSGSLSYFFSAPGVLRPAKMLLLSCKFYFELLFEYLLTTTFELELNLVY